MKDMKRILTLTGVAIMAALSLHAQSQAEAQRVALHQKAVDMVAKMTLDEKIAQMISGTPAIERLGIRPYDWWNEALHGVARHGRATSFPMPIGLGATFDAALVKQIGEVVSTEGRAKYNVAQKQKNYWRYTGLTYWSPNINIFRDPRWGRGMETYGEDPFLTGTLGTAYVRGLQGDDPVYLRTAACGKHFAVHSGPEGTRHKDNITPSLKDLNETYLPAFKMLVQEGKVEAIMGAYTRLFGESCSGSKALLTDLLRDKWGFKGHVVSDCGAVDDIYRGHGIVKTAAEAAAIAVKAGVNLECGSSFRSLHEAVDKGLVTEKEIDNALIPLMETRYRLGIIDDDPACPYNYTDETVVCSDANAAIARRAAQESMVLLKNDGALPIKKALRKIFVSGHGATDIFFLMGNYFGVSDRYSTYLEGITSHITAGTTLEYRTSYLPTQNNDKLRINNWGDARSADVAIIFIGNSGDTEGEEGDALDSNEKGDHLTMSLPEEQMEFLRRASKDRWNKIVTVVTGGSPVEMKEIEELSDAVIMAWYPGQEGGEALADLLFGDANFSGRLPITFPESTDVLPAFDDYTMKGRTYKYMTDGVMYPFGYGLSYSKVTYSDATATLTKQGLHVTATLRNESDIATSEVPQVYLRVPGAGQTAAEWTLIAFDRIDIPAKATKEISFDIPTERLMTVQDNGESKLLKGQYTVAVAAAAPLKRSEQLGVSMTKATFKK